MDGEDAAPLPPEVAFAKKQFEASATVVQDSQDHLQLVAEALAAMLGENCRLNAQALLRKYAIALPQAPPVFRMRYDTGRSFSWAMAGFNLITSSNIPARVKTPQSAAEICAGEDCCQLKIADFGMAKYMGRGPLMILSRQQREQNTCCGQGRCSLLCGGLTLALAGYACLEPVTALFVPELGWFLLAPGLLALLLGTAGCAASRGSPSKLLEAQLAVFTFLVALLLAAAGMFIFHYVVAASHWVFEGCVKYRTEGEWGSGRVKEALEAVHQQYAELSCGFQRCRLLNPLLLDLDQCGSRARCEGEPVSSLAFFRWVQHLQVGGGVGALCRFTISKLAARGSVWTTLFINWLGCILLALTSRCPSNLRPLLGTGFCGGFTTFSTFALEAVELLRQSRYATAAGYVLLSNLGGLALAAAVLHALKRCGCLVPGPAPQPRMGRRASQKERPFRPLGYGNGKRESTTFAGWSNCYLGCNDPYGETLHSILSLVRAKYLTVDRFVSVVGSFVALQFLPLPR
ncbi:unnamed protein product [Effrenium voratum]|nr:unnamed protein product [Effrenium voratum]